MTHARKRVFGEPCYSGSEFRKAMTESSVRARRGCGRVPSAALAAAGLVWLAGSAGAQPAGSAAPTVAPPGNDDLGRCVGAFERAQRLRREGRLLASETELVTCAQERCPEPIAQKCTGWLREVDAELPTVVIYARDADGADAVEVRVEVDGQVVSTRLNGRPVALDPGPRLFRFEHPGSPVVRRWLVLVAAEKNRRVALSFGRTPRGWLEGEGPEAGPDPLPPTPPTPAIPPLSYAGFAVAAAGVVVGTVTGAVALSERSALGERCPQNVCSADDADGYRHAATLARVSTVSFIAAAGGAAAGVMALLLGAPVAAGPEAATARAAVAPYAGPDGLGLRGVFW
jgi:hypothetical protein